MIVIQNPKMSLILEETKNTIISLKIQIEEEKWIEEMVRVQRKKEEEICEYIESKIISLRNNLEKTTIKLNRSLNFETSTEILDDIINFQRYPFINMGLEYDFFVASLPTPSLATTRKVLFVLGGVQNDFLEEHPIVDCAK
jgi:hypothetical protein